ISRGARTPSPTSSGRFDRWERARGITSHEPSNRSGTMIHPALTRLSRVLALGASLAVVLLASSSCASAPPPPPAPPTVPLETKMPWIFQLEDQRIVKLPETPPPPPAPVVKGKRP